MKPLLTLTTSLALGLALTGCASAPQVRYVAQPAEPIALPARPMSELRALGPTPGREEFVRACLANVLAVEGYAMELENLIKAANERVPQELK